MRSATKPTPSNIRRRLYRIEADAAIAVELSKRWNPKGRYFRAQRDLINTLPRIEESARLLRELITR
ncbi:MAG TPA: hypothetical protein VE907_06385 [Gammaproteobacteria bacterium]|nr:hypothetical protein [Gammaproteobacteria bacterium]